MKAATTSRIRLLQYAEESVQRYKRQVLAEPDSHPQTFFTRFFNKADSEGLSDLDIRNEAMAYIVAGSDTTSNTLTYLVWALCQNKDAQKALVNELQDLPDEFTDLDLRELRHLNNVINETLRLYPAAPSLLPRVVPPGGETLAGHWLPGGTKVGTQAWTLHRLPEIFPDPLKFDPARWDNPTREMKDAFMPFGGGSRGTHI
jgi:cytochrome P450